MIRKQPLNFKRYWFKNDEMNSDGKQFKHTQIVLVVDSHCAVQLSPNQLHLDIS
jgi:hypothetical protein